MPLVRYVAGIRSSFKQRKWTNSGSFYQLVFDVIFLESLRMRSNFFSCFLLLIYCYCCHIFYHDDAQQESSSSFGHIFH